MRTKRKLRKRERYDVRPDKAGIRKMKEDGSGVWKKRRAFKLN